MRSTAAYLSASAALAVLGSLAYGYGHFLALPPPAVAALAASLITPSALLFVLRCLPRYVSRARVFAFLFIALFFGNAVARYAPSGPLVESLSLAITVFLTYSLVGWLYSAIMSSTGPSVSLPRLSAAVADVVGKVAFIVFIMLASVAIVSLIVMIAGNAPLLAGDKVVVPAGGVPRVVQAGQAVREINVSVRDYAAVINVLGKYILSGVFRGNVSNPLNSVVETPFGKLVISGDLVRKLRLVEETVQGASGGSGALQAITYSLASMWEVYAPLLDPRALAILAGTALLGIGTKMVRG